mmetsp:Transcript_20106/g.43494  ORF Transcript_20106/g.43494 Transcript_20106/m.43494 type:complete len:786 (-) Transcript_20106:3922-6279(-)
MVESSELVPRWNGKRLWLNLNRLGFTGKFLGHEQEIETNDEHAQNVNMRNDWLTHMTLQPNLIDEREGVKVRAVEGLVGVDYLDQNVLTKGASYVFGPVIKALQKRGGYKEGVDLDAVPYDWRVPPRVLEERDQYYSRTLSKIEKMCEQNEGRGVVLLCHSMGCKQGHFILEYAQQVKGREWIDKYIHSYVPVGSPHIGASSALTSIVVGNNMGLPTAFLSAHCALIMGRSLGSAAWLLPLSAEGNIQTTRDDLMCAPYVKEHSLTKLSLENLDISQILATYPNMKSVRLRVKFEEDTWTTQWFQPVKGAAITLLDKDGKPLEFEFGTSPNLGLDKDRFTIQLHENGIGREYVDEETRKRKEAKDKEIGCCVGRGMFWTKKMAAGTARSIDKAARVTDQFIVISKTEFKVKDLLGDDYVPGTTKSIVKELTDVKSFGARNRTGCVASLRFSLSWESQELMHKNAGIELPKSTMNIHKSSSLLGGLGSSLTKKGNQEYTAGVYNPVELLKMEGLKETVDLWGSKYYENETCATSTPPPVKNVFAIYGINMKTEVGSAYRRVNRKLSRGELQSAYALDENTQLDKDILQQRGLKMKGGLIFETPKTPQKCVVTGTTVIKSGDGTVPYKSLQHVKTWSNACNVRVEEMEGVEHRAILDNKDFHTLLLSYVIPADYAATTKEEEEEYSTKTPYVPTVVDPDHAISADSNPVDKREPNENMPSVQDVDPSQDKQIEGGDSTGPTKDVESGLEVPVENNENEKRERQDSADTMNEEECCEEETDIDIELSG